MKERINCLPNSLIDKKRWDSCIKAACNRRIYGMSFFLDIFSPRWQAIVLDDGNAVMPVTWNSKFGISYVCQPVFVQQLGCFILDNSYSGVIPFFIDKLSSSFRFIDISMNEMNEINEMNIGNYQIFKMNNYLLRLNKPYDILINNYNTNTRRNIKKANKRGLVLINQYQPSEVVKLFRFNSGKAYPGIRSINYDRLLLLIKRGLAEGMVHIRAARAINGNIIAAACFLEDFDRYIFYFSANSDEGRRQGAMFFIIDSFIKQYADNDKFLDFNGSVNPDLARFYKGFGAETACYQRLKINRLHFPLNFFK